MTDAAGFPPPTYGRKATVGVIDLSTCTSLTPEFTMALPAEVSVVFSRLRLPGGVVSVATLREMVESSRLEEAGLELADAGVDVIAFACTSASLLLGPGFDQELAARLRAATRVGATTTATAVVDALRALGATRIAVGTPYDAEITAREQRFLEAAGFALTSIECLGLAHDREIGALRFEDVAELARRVHRPDAEALFLSCTNLPALPIVAELEAELGLPVVTSNSATIWQALRLVGVPARSAGLGRLLAGDRSAGAA
jgi:maleate isomerase